LERAIPAIAQDAANLGIVEPVEPVEPVDNRENKETSVRRPATMRN
jgi:hypothetical protein